MINNEVENVERRLVALEEKIEYQDYTIDKLNEVIIIQQQQIDKIQLELQRLREKIDAQEIDVDKQVQQIPPPHY